MSATTWHLARTGLLAAAIGLSAACTTTQPHTPSGPRSDAPIQSLPGSGAPRPTPGNKQPIKPTPKAPAKTSASFAPPPGVKSHWDQRLGVYVLDGQSNMFYRQRTYYQWDNGWNWSTQPDGPWQATDSSGVPAGLGREFGN